MQAPQMPQMHDLLEKDSEYIIMQDLLEKDSEYIITHPPAIK